MILGLCARLEIGERPPTEASLVKGYLEVAWNVMLMGALLVNCLMESSFGFSYLLLMMLVVWFLISTKRIEDAITSPSCSIFPPLAVLHLYFNIGSFIDD